MSLNDYKVSKELSKDDPPFDAIIMLAMRKADDINLSNLIVYWPKLWDELKARYNAPGGLLKGEEDA